MNEKRMSGPRELIASVEAISNWRKLFELLREMVQGRVSEWATELVSASGRVTKAKDASSLAILLEWATKRSRSFLETRIVKAVMVLPNTHKMRREARLIAALAGLMNGLDEYTRTTKGRDPEKGESECELQRALTKGFATFFPSSLPALLARWASLANQGGRYIELPRELDQSSILEWANAVLSASYDAEEEHAPIASVGLDRDALLVLKWQGTWTGGRWFSLSIDFDDPDPLSTKVTLWWNSGTGSPSTFLAIEELLALSGCQEYHSIDGTEDGA